MPMVLSLSLKITGMILELEHKLASERLFLGAVRTDGGGADWKPGAPGWLKSCWSIVDSEPLMTFCCCAQSRARLTRG